MEKKNMNDESCYLVTVSGYEYKRIAVCTDCGAPLGLDFMESKIKENEQCLSDNKCAECKQIQKTLSTKTILIGVFVFVFAVLASTITGIVTNWVGQGKSEAYWIYFILHAVFALPPILIFGFFLKAPALHNESARYQPLAGLAEKETDDARKANPKVLVFNFTNKTFADAFASKYGVSTERSEAVVKPNNSKLAFAVGDNFFVMACLVVIPEVVISTLVFQFFVKKVLLGE